MKLRKFFFHFCCFLPLLMWYIKKCKNKKHLWKQVYVYDSFRRIKKVADGDSANILHRRVHLLNCLMLYPWQICSQMLDIVNGRHPCCGVCRSRRHHVSHDLWKVCANLNINLPHYHESTVQLRIVYVGHSSCYILQINILHHIVEMSVVALFSNKPKLSYGES